MKVKWGIIGSGGIADRRTIPGLLLAKNAELVAVMDSDPGRAIATGEKYNATVYYTVDELLDDDNIDAVYIATPVNCHKEQVIKAAHAKKHILLEKPLGLTVEEGKEIVDVCAKEHVMLAAGLMMRYHACHQKMKEVVESGELGEIVSCRAQMVCWYPDIPGSWRQSLNTSGGGALMDLGVHCIDLLQYITGGKIQKIAAFTGTKSFQYEVEDSASVIFKMDNGIYGTVDTNFNIPDDASKCGIEIYGTKGSLVASNTIGQLERGDLDIILTGKSPCKADVSFGNLYTKEIESFSDSILLNKPIQVPAEDALQVQSVVEAAYQAGATYQYKDVP